MPKRGKREPILHPDQLFDNGTLPEIEDESLEADEGSCLDPDTLNKDAFSDDTWVTAAKRKAPLRPKRR